MTCKIKPSLLNNPMARRILRYIDLTSKYPGRYSGLAQETNYNLDLLVKSFINYVGTIFLIFLLSPVLLIVALLVKLTFKSKRWGANIATI